MAAIETSDMIHKAVLWILAAPDNFGNHGNAEDGYPIEIDCRWEDKYEEIIDTDNKVIAVEATVAVKQNVPIGALIWKGAASALPADWSDITHVKKVYVVQKSDDIKGRNTRRILKVRKYKNSVPTTTTTAAP